MDIVSFCALRVSSLPWQPREGAFALTVICKATFELGPGASLIATVQEAVWDATRAASDLAPFKRRADVLVVGHAFPPNGRPASAPVSLVARLGVGSMQKAIEVRADRGWVAEGFGPVRPTSPSRTTLLGRHAGSWDHRAWNTKPLPEDVDGAFFNVAPVDQQLAELVGDEGIVLEHLHPSFARIETKLARVVPRATVQRAAGQAQEVRLRCDTLSIDTDRQIAMLVWRGVVLLAQAAEEGLVVVTAEGLDGGVGDDVEGTLTLVPTGKNLAPAPVLPFVPGGPGLPSIAIRDEATRAAPPRPPKNEEEDEGAGPTTLTHVGVGMTSKPVTPFEQAIGGAQAEAGAEGPDTRPLDVPAKEERTEAWKSAPPMPFDVSPPALLGFMPRIEAAPTTARVVEKPAKLGPLAGGENNAAEATVAGAGCSIEPAPTTEPAGARRAAMEEPEPDTSKELTVEQVAAVAAELAEGKQERAKVLDMHGLRERAWRKNERRWADAIEAESARGTHALRGAYDAAYVAKVEGFRGPITLEEYTRLLVALERGKTNEVLDGLRIHRPALMPIVRLWTRKVATDMKLGDAANETLRVARRA